MRIRAEAGESHIDWLPKGPGTEAHQTTFRIRGSEWEEISVELPATGPLGVVRVYLPPQSPPIQIDWIEITSHGDDRKTRTNFDTAR
jgi:hypothetical protein